MRILHVVTVVDGRNSYGGPLAVGLSQCQELRRRGHDTMMVAGRRGLTGAPTVLEGLPCRLFPTWTAVPGLRFSGLVSMRMLWWVLRHARSFDVVHVHLARDLIPLLLCTVLRLMRVPYVVQTHGMVVPDPRPVCRVLDAALTVPVLRAAQVRFVLTDDEDAAVAAVAGPAWSRERLENGIALPALEPRPVRDVPDALFLARLHPRKRVLDFVAVACALLDEGVQATFSIVGGDDGDLARLRSALVARPDLAGRLRYEGGLAHERALERIGRADVYVLPSVEEPYPMTVLEAMARGVPVVITDRCGLAAPLHGVEGVEVSAPDPSSLTACVRRLLLDPVGLNRRGAAARKAAAVSFSIAAVVDQLQEAYRRQGGTAARRES